MIEIRPLFPRTWEPSEPHVAYNKADRRVVIASAMSRGNNSYYDRYGYRGSRDIVCIDCLEAGHDVPVSLVVAENKVHPLPAQARRGSGRYAQARRDSRAPARKAADHGLGQGAAPHHALVNRR
ncbi:hypothetical protein J7I84_16625 [Arthrobacter sp. ISL-85]|uniref:hypothetical protein n=1 Tax=Arthrobacter sp. ISL-85 TaxID=2819115 RepID=UPI001BE650A5|nr:hypothetical protein [Arthrobacter sp. ISL-85]MBT2568092.1 hypothetical protein [Arthrobacter sp. ISL-85]